MNRPKAIPTDAGVYVILHNPSGRRYVGMTENFKRRFAYHKSALRGGRHHNPALQNDWFDFPESEFEFKVASRFETAKDLMRRYAIERELISSLTPEQSYNAIAAHMKSRDKSGNPLKRRIVKLNSEEWGVFDASGGIEWLRKLIHRAKPPA